jgi:hypothetical protein
MKCSPTPLVIFVGVLLASQLLAEAPEQTVVAANSGDANAMFDLGSIAR